MTSKTNKRRPGVSAAAYTNLSEIIVRYAAGVEALISGDLAYPFSVVPSDAVRDHAADEQRHGTRTKKALTNLAMSQVHAVGAQCDLHRGMAAVLPAEKVFFSPYPLARTCVVVAAKAWFVLGGAICEERLQRYLNEELGALYGASWDFTDPDSCADIAAWEADHVAVGATAGLRAVRKKNPKNWDAPYLVRSDQQDGEKPPPETTVVREMFAASGLGADQVGKPYTLLSAATHGRFRQSGVSESIPTGRTEFGVPTIAMHSSAETTAKVTVLAALATRTHLRALAQYANVPEQLVQDRLGDPLAEWCEIGGMEVPN